MSTEKYIRLLNLYEILGYTNNDDIISLKLYIDNYIKKIKIVDGKLYFNQIEIGYFGPIDYIILNDIFVRRMLHTEFELDLIAYLFKKYLDSNITKLYV